VRWLRDFLRRLASEGRTVLISSHVLAEVAQTVDRVHHQSRVAPALVLTGRVVAPALVLTGRVDRPCRRCGSRPQRLTTALRDEDLHLTTCTDHALLVHGASSERIGEIAFAAGVPVHELVNEGGVLEDIFLEQTSEVAA
jgi:ABC-2 type transport system ATP-binding protein